MSPVTARAQTAASAGRSSVARADQSSEASRDGDDLPGAAVDEAVDVDECVPAGEERSCLGAASQDQRGVEVGGVLREFVQVVGEGRLGRLRVGVEPVACCVECVAVVGEECVELVGRQLLLCGR